MDKIYCQICKFEFKNSTKDSLRKSITVHLCKAHKFNLKQRIDYLQSNFGNCNIINKNFIFDLYINKKMSTIEIAEFLKQKYWEDIELLTKKTAINKSFIRRLLKIFDIKSRNHIDSRKVKYENGEIVWNKGLTKNDHSSIMKYSLSRIGSKNGMYGTKGSIIMKKYYSNLPKNSIKYKNWIENISNTIKKKWENGELKPYWIMQGFVSYKEWLENQSIEKQNEIKRKQIEHCMKNIIIQGRRKPSNPEIKIGNILTEYGIEFVRQKRIIINKKNYICDLFIESLNLVIEIFGDYWHCNPKKYKENYFHSVKQKTAKELWEEDFLRIKNLNTKYKTVVLWEDFINKTNKENILKKIKENI